MDQVELTSQGWWRPSPGSVYPLLEEMQKEGSVIKREDGRYEITEKGRQEFEWPWGIPTAQPRSVEGVIAEMNSYVSYLEDLNRSDRSKLAPYIDRLKSVRDRLATLLNSP